MGAKCEGERSDGLGFSEGRGGLAVMDANDVCLVIEGCKRV